MIHVYDQAYGQPRPHLCDSCIVMDLSQQVSNGQAALGKLVRQFLSRNDFRHVQFMTMAHAVTGARWLHSSQISTLKQGGSRNLTGFPLFSLAAVNRRIYEVNTGLAAPPAGTPRSDWEHKQPMLRPDGQPLDIGDLWRIYFGEMDAPLFTDMDLPEFDDKSAATLSRRLHELYIEHCKSQGHEPMAYLPVAIALFQGDADQQKLLKGVLLGVIDLDAEQAQDLGDAISRFLTQLLGRDFSLRQLMELSLGD